MPDPIILEYNAPLKVCQSTKPSLMASLVKIHQPTIEDLCDKHPHFQWRQTQLTCLLESLLPSYAAVLRYRVS